MFFLPILIFLQEMHVGPRPGSDETGETTPGVLVVTPLRLEDTVKPWSCPMSSVKGQVSKAKKVGRLRFAGYEYMV
jgi:hypothetical protein